MIVNRNYHLPSTAHITLDKGYKLTGLYDRSTRTWKPAPSKDIFGTYPVQLAPGEGQLLSLAITGS